MNWIKPFKTTIIACTISGIITLSPIIAQAELGDTVLKKGITHEDVKTLQEYLIDLGYLHIEEATTYFGDETEKAVMEFQKTQGLDPDGSFGKATYEALLNILMKYKPLSYTRPLREGLSGEDVHALQERLKILGFLDIDECTDYYGSMTKQAVLNFQQEYGIQVDGKAGPETIRTINKALSDIVTIPDSLSSRDGLNGRSLGARIVSKARELLGSPYKYGGTSPSGFDCSGFTYYIYKQFGIELPHSSSGQANVGVKVSKSDLQLGDIVVFSNTYTAGPSHTGIYIGNGKFIHASTSSKGVIISDLNTQYYSKHFSYGRRVLK